MSPGRRASIAAGAKGSPDSDTGSVVTAGLSRRRTTFVHADASVPLPGLSFSTIVLTQPAPLTEGTFDSVSLSIQRPLVKWNTVNQKFQKSFKILIHAFQQ